VVDAFVSNDADAVQYIAKIRDMATGAVTAQSMLLAHAGTSVYITEYAIVHTSGSMGVFSCTVDTGVISVIFTPTVANNLYISLIKFYL
jgi:hypothetical protein